MPLQSSPSGSPMPATGSEGVIGTLDRRTKFDIYGKTTYTLEESLRVIESLPTEDRTDALLGVGNQIVQLTDLVGDVVEKWADLLQENAQKLLGKKGEEEFNLRNTDFKDRHSEIKTPRNEKLVQQNKLKEILQKQGDVIERALKFQEYSINEFKDRGKSFWTNLVKLFNTGRSTRTIIQLLNMFIIRNNASLLRYQNYRLENMILKNALDYHNNELSAGRISKYGMIVDEIKAEDLRKHCLTFQESGLLVKADSYHNKQFPIFPDEPSEWPSVIVVGNEPAEAPQFTLPAVLGELKDDSATSSTTNEVLRPAWSTASLLQNEATEVLGNGMLIGDVNAEFEAACDDVLSASGVSNVLGQQQATGLLDGAAKENPKTEVIAAGTSMYDSRSTTKDGVAATSGGNKRPADETSTEGHVDKKIKDSAAKDPKSPTTPPKLNALVSIPKKGTPGKPNTPRSSYNRGTNNSGTPVNKPLTRGSVRSLACKCPKTKDLNDDWKMKVQAWEGGNLKEFKDKRSCLFPIANVLIQQPTMSSDYQMPCIAHLRRICGLIGIDYDLIHQKEMSQIVWNIWDCTDTRLSFHKAWVLPETRDYFIQTDEIIAYHKQALTRSKFLPQRVKTLEPPHNTTFDFSLGYLEDKGYFGWLRDDPQVFDIIQNEIRMMSWHYPTELTDGNGFLGNAYFSIIQQLVWANPLIWFFHYQVKGEPFLVAYPQSLRYFPGGHVQSEMYEGEKDLKKTASALCGTLLLEGETGMPIDYYFSRRDNGDCLGRFANFIQSSLGGIESFDCLQEQDLYTKLDAFFQTNSNDVFKKTLTADPLTTTIHFSGFCSKRNWIGENKLLLPRTEIPFSFLSVDTDRGICENGVPLKEVKRSHNMLEVPSQERFSHYTDDKVFPCSVRLENIGPIFDMIRCKEEPDSPAVLHEIEKWRSATKEERMKYQDEWIELAKIAVKEAGKKQREWEESKYQPKSFFEHGKRKNYAVEPDPDRDYIVISDDEDDGFSGHNGDTTNTDEERSKNGTDKDHEDMLVDSVEEGKAKDKKW